jgi:uncharacterized Zn finger protein
MPNLTPTQIQNAKNVQCEGCGNETFKQLFVIKFISGLLNPDGKDMFAPVPVFSCDSCGHFNKVFDELKINQNKKEATEVIHTPV